MKLLKKIMIIILCFVFLCGCKDIEPIENLAVVIGFGYDVEKDDEQEDEPQLVSVMEFLSIKKKDEAGADYLDGKGSSIYYSIENYKAKQGKPFRYGSEIVYIISEERAKFGIEDVVYDLLSYPGVNINARILVCKDKCKDYFELESDTGSVSESLSNLVKFENQEYFSSSDYTVNDFLCMHFQQGRRLYLPYIEIINGAPQLTGAAVFKNNKFLMKIPIEEANFINILRASGGNGIINIPSEEPLKYLEMEGKDKTKVKVTKENNQLKYNVKVNITGDLRIDTLDNVEFNKEQISKIQKDFEDKLKKDLNAEISKIQNEYGIDCLDFGKYALAEFGRDSGYDSDEYFSNADINVDVKIKIKSSGRVRKSPIEN